MKKANMLVLCEVRCTFCEAGRTRAAGGGLRPIVAYHPVPSFNHAKHSTSMVLRIGETGFR